MIAILSVLLLSVAQAASNTTKLLYSTTDALDLAGIDLDVNTYYPEPYAYGNKALGYGKKITHVHVKFVRSRNMWKEIILD